LKIGPIAGHKESLHRLNERGKFLVFTEFPLLFGLLLLFCKTFNKLIFGLVSTTLMQVGIVGISFVAN
jgi:hypothetical protein